MDIINDVLSETNAQILHRLEERLNSIELPIYSQLLNTVDDVGSIMRSFLKEAVPPVRDRLYLKDIDNFKEVRKITPEMVSHSLDKNGYLDWSEDRIQIAFEEFLNVPFHKKDWGGEINDLYSANLSINGLKVPTAFLLKGNGLKRPEMRIADCGKNGDQLVRLFKSPAYLFVVQFVGNISEAVISDVQSKVAERRAAGRPAWFLIMDGQATARLLYAYGKLK